MLVFLSFFKIVNEVIYSYGFPPPFFVNIFIFYVNIWIVNVCTECVVGMYFKKECIRVWNYGVEAIFLYT